MQIKSYYTLKLSTIQMYIDKIHCQMEFVACHNDIIKLKKMLQLLKLFFNFSKICRIMASLQMTYIVYISLIRLDPTR